MSSCAVLLKPRAWSPCLEPMPGARAWSLCSATRGATVMRDLYIPESSFCLPHAEKAPAKAMKPQMNEAMKTQWSAAKSKKNKLKKSSYKKKSIVIGETQIWVKVKECSGEEKELGAYQGKSQEVVLWCKKGNVCLSGMNVTSCFRVRVR